MVMDLLHHAAYQSSVATELFAALAEAADEIETVAKERDDLDDRAVNLAGELEELRGQLGIAVESATGDDAAYNTLRDQYDRLRDQLDNAESAVSSLVAERAELRRERDQLTKQNDTQRTTIESYRVTNLSIADELLQLKSDVEVTRNQVAQLEFKLADVRHEATDLGLENVKLRGQLDPSAGNATYNPS